jgi:hypothetical protein
MARLLLYSKNHARKPQLIHMVRHPPDLSTPQVIHRVGPFLSLSIGTCKSLLCKDLQGSTGNWLRISCGSESLESRKSLSHKDLRHFKKLDFG